MNHYFKTSMSRQDVTEGVRVVFSLRLLHLSASRLLVFPLLQDPFKRRFIAEADAFLSGLISGKESTS